MIYKSANNNHFLLIEFDVRLYNNVKNATQKWLRKLMELSKICYSDVRCGI